MNSNRSKAIAAGLMATSVIASLPACHRLEQMAATLADRRKAFAQLSVGMNGATREQLIDAMGQPHSTRIVGLIGLGQGEILTFLDSTNQYLVLVIGDHAVMKHAAPRSADKEVQS